MKKLLVLITVLALCAFALAGCGAQNPNDGGNGTATEAPADPGVIVIDGTEYTLPVPVAAFTESGWEMIGEEKFAEEYEPGDTQAPGSTGLKKSDSDIKSDIEIIVKTIDKSYFSVVNIDKSYLN